MDILSYLMGDKGEGGGNAPLIPNEYQRVEYIQGMGSGAVIDTGVYPAYNLSVLLNVEPQEETPDCLFGTKGTLPMDKNDWRIFNFQGKLYVDVGAGDNLGRLTIDTPFGVGVKRFIYAGNRFAIDADEGTLLGAGGPRQFTEEYPTTLFINGGSLAQSANAKWYEVKIANRNKLVRDFVPCYRKATSECGLYDRVTGTFYTNAASSGYFSAGPDVTTPDDTVIIILG